MKNIRIKTISTAAMALALVLIFACLSPCAQALGHGGHEDWKAVSSGNRKTLEDGKYYLKSDLKGDVVIKGQVELCLNGHSITGTGNGSVITVSDGASLSLCDCSSKGCITGGKATEGGGIYVGENASLNMEGGCVTGNQATRGGGIFAADSAALTVTGGDIEENSSKSGGGLYLEGPADISACTIKDNTCEYTGAGIYAEGDKENRIILSAVNIQDNVSAGHGGGIYIKSCRMDMLSGSVAGNQVTAPHASGGGVYVDEYAGFTMGSGVKIEDNTAANSGGGICISGGTPASDFTMEGGEIKGNSALNGGGIASTGVGCFEILGGEISGNSASADGGGIYISFGFTRDVSKLISGCTISENSAVNYGGGIFLQGNSFIDVGLCSDKIEDNSALDGGGVYVNQLENLSLSGLMSLEDNECSGRGPNLYLHSAETMSVSTLSSGSTIGLSLEYADNSSFTRDVSQETAGVSQYFVSNMEGFGIVPGKDGQLQFSPACRVDFDAKGGRLEESFRMYTNGQALGTLPIPEKEGYTFTYWDYSGRRVSESDVVTFDKTLSANYEFNNYTVKFDPNGGSGSMADQACRYTVPFKLSECIFTRDGYVFDGWSLSPQGPAEYADRDDVCNLCGENGGSITLYAQWRTEPAQSVSLAEKLELAVGESRLPGVTPEPAGSDTSGLVWTCEDEDIIALEADGRITGLAPGTTTLSVETESGFVASCTVEVGRRAPNVSDFVFTEERSFSYDGSGKTPVLLSYPQGMDFAVRYVRAEDGSESYEVPSQPGSYSIYIDVKENDSYEEALGLSDKAWNFVVLQGSQQPLSIEGEPEALYFGQAFTLSVSGGSGDGPLSWQLSSGDCAVVNSQTGDVYITGTGDFSVTVTKAGNGVYDDVSASASFTALKRPLYLEAQPEAVTEKTYDGSDSAQLVSSGTVAGFRPEDEGSIPVQAVARYNDKNAGYGKTITVSYDLGDYAQFYQAPEDYVISDCVIYPLAAQIAWDYSQPLVYNCAAQQLSAYVANALPGDSVSCTGYEGASAVDAGDDYTAYVTSLDNPNYSLEGAQGNYLLWSIQPRTITIKADQLHKVYGAFDPVFSYTCTDPEPPVLTGSMERDPGEDVGAYYIRQGSLALTDGPGFAARNYVLNFVDGLLTVDVAGNDIYNFSCGDVAYGSQPMPSAQAAYGSVSFSYSQSPDGPFGPWDVNNAPGTWYVMASVEGTYNYNGAQAVISFTLLNEELQSIVEPESVYLSGGGDLASSLAAALPSQVEIVNNRGLRSQYTAQVWWDTEHTGYDPAVQGMQVLTVSGTVTLPQEVNNSYGVSLELSIQVYVEPGFSGSISGGNSGSGSGGSLGPLPSGDGGLSPLPSGGSGLSPLPSGGSSDPFL